MKFAVQMYSMRSFIDEHGVEAAFKTIAEAGFTGVEFAGFYGMQADEIRSLLEKYRLEAVSAHVGVEDIEAQLPLLKELGVRYAVVPYIDFNRSVTLPDGVNSCKKALKIFKENGIAVGYHNHAHEFANGVDAVAYLAENIPEMQFEPDVFWLAAAGIDALEFMKKYRDRLCFIHLKELGESAEGINPVLGAGRANIAEVTKLGERLGVAWSILEVENTEMPMREYLTESYQFLKKIL